MWDSTILACRCCSFMSWGAWRQSMEEFGKMLEVILETKLMSLSSNWAVIFRFSELSLVFCSIKTRPYLSLSFSSAPVTTQTKAVSGLFHSSGFMFFKCSTVAGFFRSGCCRSTIVFKPVKGLLAWWGQSYMYMPIVSQEDVYIHLCKIKVQIKIVAFQIWNGNDHSSQSVQYEPWKIVCQDSPGPKFLLEVSSTWKSKAELL